MRWPTLSSPSACRRRSRTRRPVRLPWRETVPARYFRTLSSGRLPLTPSPPSSPIAGMLFWAFTMFLWYRILGWLFLPVGVYFAGLVSPAFNPVSKGDSHRHHGAQVGSSLVYGFLLSALVVYPNFSSSTHPWTRRVHRVHLLVRVPRHETPRGAPASSRGPVDFRSGTRWRITSRCVCTSPAT